MKRLSPYLITSLAACVAICAAAIGTGMYLRELALSQTETNLRNLNRAIAAQTEAVLSASEAVLSNVRDGLERPGKHSQDEIQAFLDQQSKKAAFLRAMTIAGQDGALLYLSNLPAPDAKIDFSDRRWFLDAKESTERNLRIGEPVKSKIVGLWLIPLVLRLNTPDGSFNGTVSGSLDPVFFQRLFKEFDLGPGAAITLQRIDSMVLAREPHSDDIIGKTFPKGPIYQVMKQQKEGFIRATSAIDQIERLISGNVVGNYPLYVAISVTEESALRGWRAQAGVIAAAALALILLVITLGALANRLQHQIQARRKADQVLSQNIHALAEKERLLRETQEVAQLGHYTFDVASGLWKSSEVLDSIFGIDAAYKRDMEGWISLVSPELRDEMQDYLAGRLASQDEFNKGYWIVRQSDGERRFVLGLGRIERDEDGKAVRVLGAIRDITEQKKAEDEIRRSNAELEQFAYVASHDLREPLRMISSYVALLERRFADKLDDDGREFIHFAKDGAQRMDHLILDLLEYSRIGRVCDSLELSDLGAILQSALAILEPSIKESQAEIRFPASLPSVMASGDEITRLFQNLIGNALKYRSPDRPCRIEIAVKPLGRSWVISIADNGIGIDPKNFGRIFQIFQRLHGREAFGGGSGIGLSICKKIVERHGGRIWIESAGEGQGSTFFFTLPQASPHTAGFSAPAVDHQPVSA